MGQVTYIEANGASHTIEGESGENVMRGALDQDLPGIAGECGGGLACATCHCYVDEAWTALTGRPSSQDETDRLECSGRSQTQQPPIVPDRDATPPGG